jgi:predicted methyltransferase
MATQGRAAKSSSGAAMSKYDVEVEARLKALEAKAHEKCDGGGVSASKLKSLEERIAALEASDKAQQEVDARFLALETKVNKLWT